MMAQTQEHQANRRGIILTAVLLGLIAIGIFVGSMVYQLYK